MIFTLRYSAERLDGGRDEPTVVHVRVEEIALIRVDAAHGAAAARGVIVLRSGFKLDPVLLTPQWDALLAAFQSAR